MVRRWERISFPEGESLLRSHSVEVEVLWTDFSVSSDTDTKRSGECGDEIVKELVLVD